MPQQFRRLGPVPQSLPVGKDSLSWRVGREPSLLLGGGRALLLQVTHPLVAAGVDQHSNYQADPWSRLFATLDTVYTMMFAAPDEAQKAADRLKRRHQMVRGTAEDGSPYDALDPDLQLWVWATLVDTALVVYERCLGPLSDDLRTRYLDEQKLFAYACGVPDGRCPATYTEFADYVATTINERLRATTVAHDVAISLREPPLPKALQPVAGPVSLVTGGLLPPHLRVALGFEWGPKQERNLKAFFAAAATQRALPGPVRRLPVALSSRRSSPMTPPKWLTAQTRASSAMPEAPAKRRRLGHDERRGLILDQACALFARNTFTAVSMEDIAKAAGVTRGLLNHYFGTKRELYLEVVRHLTRLPPSEDPSQSAADLDQSVADNVDRFLDNAERNRHFWLATLGGAGFGRDRELEKVVADVEDAYVDRIIEIFGGDPTQTPASDRATLRGYGAFALAITREWLADKRISRDQAHAILRRTLLAIVRDLAAGEPPMTGRPLHPIRTATAADSR